jgi:hypothetical protein
MTTKTLRAWPHWLARMLFQHLPEQPYPSDHPTALRRSPRDARG